MGWASAGNIFDVVATGLIKAEASDAIKRDVLGMLVGALQEEDWDTEDESLEQFADDQVIVEVFREHGVGLSDEDDG